MACCHQRPERIARHREIVPRPQRLAIDLTLLVALAGQDDGVAGTAAAEELEDSSATVLDALEIDSAPAAMAAMIAWGSS
ncbi:hypothetical protein BH23CHL1_BH23CHL1_26350 [soil metagenome]